MAGRQAQSCFNEERTGRQGRAAALQKLGLVHRMRMSGTGQLPAPFDIRKAAKEFSLAALRLVL